MTPRKRNRARKPRIVRRLKPPRRKRLPSRKARTIRRHARSAVQPRRRAKSRTTGRRPAAPRAAGGSPGERLSTDHAAFWAGGDLAALTVDIAPSRVPGGTLKRLGPPPLGADAGLVERTLRRTYAAAAALALSLGRR